MKIIDYRNTKKPKISVIMSVYNNGNYLEQSIKSILNQKYKNLEFIIINDGSTDNTEKIIRKYLKKKFNILFINSKKNYGLPYMLNLGIKYSKGLYIARQDADDISHKLRFSEQINFMKNNAKVDVLGTNAIQIYKSQKNKTNYTSNSKFIKKYDRFI